MIIFFRTKVLTPFNILMVIAIFLTSSCQQQKMKFELIYSGEELIRGVFLGEGVVADNIPELAGSYIPDYFTDPSEKQQIINHYNNIINEMRNNNPDVFSQFKDAVSSGNHNDILNAINLTRQEMGNAATNLGISRDLALEQQYLSEIENVINSQQITNPTEINNIIGNFVKNKANNGNPGPQEFLAILLVLVFVLVLWFCFDKSNGNGPFNKNIQLRNEMIVNGLIKLNKPVKL